MVEFSVFLPVRNGWPYIKECVESILNQTYSKFQLVILDNASCDHTMDWVSSLSDPRIKVVRSEQSLSIQESWARIKTEPKLEYMTMIGHDDVFDNNFLEIVNDLIVKYPDASLYQTGSRLINSKGKIIRSCKKVPLSETADEYLLSRLSFQRDVFGTGYVMRSEDYDRLGGIFNFERLFFADDALWLSLCKQSRKVSDPRQAFSVRIHPQSESASLPRSWRSILLGLSQFSAFLDGFVQKDEALKKVYTSNFSSFILSYCRNVYVYALVEACQENRKITQESIDEIEGFLRSVSPKLPSELHNSPKVKFIALLNTTFLRVSVKYLWNIYAFFKSKAL